MQISKREKNILMLAGLVVLVFIATRALPAIQNIYQERAAGIDALLLDMEREVRLIENTLNWRERRVIVEEQTAELDRQIFSGDTIPLVEAGIQRDLSQYARDSGVTVSSTRLAEQLETGSWLMISQEMSFRTGNAANTVSFLRRLENSEPRLYVKDLSISRSRNQYTGSITVVGFARSQGLVTAPVAQR